MVRRHFAVLFMVAAFGNAFLSEGMTQQITPSETQVDAPNGLPIVVRMQGPYDADVQLQIVCYFQRTSTSDVKLYGAPVELDKRLGGVIASLRERGEFKGDEFETILITPPVGFIQPMQLLLIGLGKESDLSLARMEAVGRTAFRESARIGAKRVAFAPLIKDAGNDTFAAGDVENAVVRGMLLARDTEARLHNQGFAKPYELNVWIVEAGPKYYDETVAGVRKATAEAKQTIDQRVATAYSALSK